MRFRVLSLSLLAVVASGAHAADKDVEAILKTLRENYQKVKTARLEVTSVIADPESGSDISLNSVMSYKGPGSVRIVAKGPTMPGSYLLYVTDSKQALVRTPDGKSSTKKFDADEVAVPLNLESLCFWDYKRQLSTAAGMNMHDSKLRLLKKETWKDKDYMVLEEKAERSKVFVRYFIDPATKYIVRTVVYNLEDTTEILQDHKVTKFELNPKLDASLFKLKA